MDLNQALDALQMAHQAGQISAAAHANIELWLRESRYANWREQVIEHLAAGRWQDLEDAFWSVIPFGTAGRRGRMYPIGSNAINEATIGETAQGLANYVLRHGRTQTDRSCAIAFDTRHRSAQFARLCVEIMAAAGFHVIYFTQPRSTPLLATTVRARRCDCGIMITASHNPPSDNAIKIFWSHGGQVRPPHDNGILQAMQAVQQINRLPFDDAVTNQHVTRDDGELEDHYLRAVTAQGYLVGQRDKPLSILFSPLHGVGQTSIVPALQRAGFPRVTIYAEHAKPDGDFPNVPNHIANPENPAVFDQIIRHAELAGDVDLILASDPDADRIGCAARTAFGAPSWRPLSGNQIAVLLADYLLHQRQSHQQSTHQDYLVKTLVTTDMLRRIGDAYGVRTYGDVLTGFKWIAAVIDEHGSDGFVLGCEEAHGYLAGSHCRDKDGAVAAVLLAEVAQWAAQRHRSLHQQLDLLYLQHGVHAERTLAIEMPGADGMQEMARIMARCRQLSPLDMTRLGLVRIKDYLLGVQRTVDQPAIPLTGPRSDLLMLDTERPGCYVAVRPSGTEPKIKFYFFVYQPRDGQDLAQVKAELEQHIDAMAANMISLCMSPKS